MWPGRVPGWRDGRSAAMVALALLGSGLDARLVRLGYKDSPVAWYRGWRGGRGVRLHAGGIPVQDHRAETVRCAVLPEVHVRRGTGRRRRAGRGPVGE